ncbi:nucleotide exchange factor GrpE [Chamaesiphon sp.]|uniref:nucleotide exchange factor GrpE n=1 Tax=Chamaesiphon sp. TaxID=2814140 RepID=UPI0035936AC4
MSETPQQQSRPDDETLSSPLPSDNLEPQPAAETVTSSATAPTAAIDPDVVVEGGAATPESFARAAQTSVDPETVAPSGSDLQSLTTKLAEVSNQRDAFQSQYLRIAADFDNFRKRSSKEKEDVELKTKCATIIELLSVVDNFERARTQIKPQGDGEMGIHKSYQSVYKQLVDSLKRIGVSPMKSAGQQFDPNLHEAVMRQPTEEHPEGTVIDELQRGYYLGDRILRHALVKVAALPEQLSPEDVGTFNSSVDN